MEALARRITKGCGLTLLPQRVFPLYLRLKTDKDGCILASFDAKIEPILWLLQSRGVCYFQYPALQPKLQEYQLQASLAQVCPSYISYHFVFRASPRTLYK